MLVKHTFWCCWDADSQNIADIIELPLGWTHPLKQSPKSVCFGTQLLLRVTKFFNTQFSTSFSVVAAVVVVAAAAAVVVDFHHLNHHQQLTVLSRDIFFTFRSREHRPRRVLVDWTPRSRNGSGTGWFVHGRWLAVCLGFEIFRILMNLGIFEIVFCCSSRKMQAKF